MSGIYFGNSGVRFSRRFSVFDYAMHYLAFLLTRRRTRAARLFPAGFRQHEAEFSSATQTSFELLERAFRSVRAGNRVPNARHRTSPSKRRTFGALRPQRNRVIIEDHYGISFIRKERPSSARRITQTGRVSPARPSGRGTENGGKAVVLAEDRRFFWQWKNDRQQRPQSAGAQRLAVTRATAAALA
jgi:hypothetical protein